MSSILKDIWFRPEEGNVLDIASLQAIGSGDHAGLYTLLTSLGTQKNGCVLEGLRASPNGYELQISEGTALLPDSGGQMVVLRQPNTISLPFPTDLPAVVVGTVREKQTDHPASGLQGAGRMMELSLGTVSWAEATRKGHVLIALLLEQGKIDNDLCRLAQPDEPEVVKLVERLRSQLVSVLANENTARDAENVQAGFSALDAREHMYIAGLQQVILQLRSRPSTSQERVRLITELSIQVRLLLGGVKVSGKEYLRVHHRFPNLHSDLNRTGYVMGIRENIPRGAATLLMERRISEQSARQ